MAILVIFDNVPQLAGWSVQEVAFLYGISDVAFSLTELAVGHLDLLPQLIRDGNFDLVLVEPRGSLLQVIASDFRLRQFRKASSVDGSARVRRRGGRHRLDGGSYRHGRGCRARRSRDLRGHLGGGHHHRVLGRGGTRVGQLVHRQGQLPLPISDRRLRHLAAALRDLRRADGIRGVLSGAHHPRQARPARRAGLVPFASPAVALVAAVVAGYMWRFAVRHYQTPAADGSDRAGERREGVRRAAQARPCPAGAQSSRLWPASASRSKPARSRAISGRQEWGWERHYGEDADRHPRPVLGANLRGRSRAVSAAHPARAASR